MPKEYLLLRKNGKHTEVVFCNTEKKTESVHFRGGRWEARRFLKDYRASVAWENVLAFNQKKGRNGHAGSLVEVPQGVL